MLLVNVHAECEIMTLRQNDYIRIVKHLFPIVLLVIFSFNIIGYYFLFLLEASENRNEIRSELFHSNVETIRISKSDIANIEIKDEGDEIFFNGELYDVKDRSVEGNFVVFHCIHDKKETKLFAELDKTVKANSNSKSSNQKQDTSKNPLRDLFVNSINNFSFSGNEFAFPDSQYPLTANDPAAYTPPPPKMIA